MPAKRSTLTAARSLRTLARRWGMPLAVGGLSLLGPDSQAADHDQETRREQIAALQPAEQQELLRKQERFQALPSEEQQRLRALQAAIDADPNSQRLQLVLKRYHEWLKTLTPVQRAELAELSPSERVKSIQRIQKQQREARERMHRVEVLSRDDVRQIAHWAEAFIWEHRQKILASMSPEQRARFEKLDTPRQHRTLIYKSFERSRRGEGAGLLASITPQDFEQLTAKLSEPARQELAKATNPAEQRKILGAWIGSAMRRTESWLATRKLSPLVGEELVQFLQNEVPPSQRNRLMRLPREEMLEELQGMYFESGRGDLFRSELGEPWLEGAPSNRPAGGFPGKEGRPLRPPFPRRDPPAENAPQADESLKTN